MKRNMNLVLAGVVLSAASGVASAATSDIDYSAITSSIATAGLITAVMSLGLVKFGPQIAKWGLAKLTSMFGGN
jgi:hypothetical protein